MYTVPTTRLVDVFIQTTELTPERAVIHYVAQVQGNCLVTVTLRDRDGRVVATGVGGNAKLTVENPHVWSISSGYLYTMELERAASGHPTLEEQNAYAWKITAYLNETKDNEITEDFGPDSGMLESEEHGTGMEVDWSDDDWIA